MKKVALILRAIAIYVDKGSYNHRNVCKDASMIVLSLNGYTIPVSLLSGAPERISRTNFYICFDQSFFFGTFHSI